MIAGGFVVAEGAAGGADVGAGGGYRHGTDTQPGVRITGGSVYGASNQVDSPIGAPARSRARAAVSGPAVYPLYVPTSVAGYVVSGDRLPYSIATITPEQRSFFEGSFPSALAAVAWVPVGSYRGIPIGVDTWEADIEAAFPAHHVGRHWLRLYEAPIFVEENEQGGENSIQEMAETLVTDADLPNSGSEGPVGVPVPAVLVMVCGIAWLRLRKQ
jgi:hypothetical protein